MLFFFSRLEILGQWSYCTQSSNPCNGKSLGNYTLSGNKWNKSAFKYYFINGTSDIPGDGEKSAFQAAFSAWSQVVPLTFTETYTESEADIKIKFASYNEYCSAWPGGETSSYACSWQPGLNCSGIILLNDENYVFSLDPNQPNAKDLVFVAMHEIGHTLGLCHSSSSSTVMCNEYNPKRTLHDYDIQGIKEIYPSIKVKNNFSNGTIKVGINKPAEFVDSLWTTIGVSQTVNLEAVEQNSGGYDRVWNDNSHPEAPLNKSKWVRNNSTGSSNRSSDRIYSFTSSTDDYNSEYIANLRKVCNVTFQNSMPEGGNIGTITVDGTNYNATKTVQKVEANTVSFYSPSQSATNGVNPIFYRWSDGDSSSSRTQTVSSNANYTAIYKGKPSTSGRYLHFNDGAYGSPVTLYWKTHPSSNVTGCKIYRKVRVNGVMGNEYLIASVSTSDTSYIDQSYTVSSSTTTQLFYDVRYVYTGTLPDNTQYTTESDPSYVNIYGQMAPSYNDSQKETATTAQELPNEYSITNYPNPFNPTTTINYQLPGNGFVTIKVYDVLGKEVATLVNENKSAGYYNVNFDASKLTSGVYIYTINVNGFAQSKKMLLMK